MLTVNSYLKRKFLCFPLVSLRFCGGIMPFSSEYPLILGIETSCDDTAVCILTNRLLSSRRYSNRFAQVRLGGICPSVSALQHRELLDVFVTSCLHESKLRLSDLDGVAVTSRPGLVIALKAGIMRAIALAKKGRLPLISVHHMQAHATIATFCDFSIGFPFITFLISGGHTLIAVSRGPDNFELFAKSLSGSCGECIDKITRALLRHMNVENKGHPGAVLEKLASRVKNAARLKYRITMPPSVGANFDFECIKNSYLSALEKLFKEDDFEPAEFCASVQHSIAGYLASKLHNCLEYLSNAGKLKNMSRVIVLSGGVASNAYVLEVIKLVAASHKFEVFCPPSSLCTDNAEMIAWNGSLLIRHGSSSVYPYEKLPTSLFAEARSPIGIDLTSLVPSHPRKKLSVKHLAEGNIVFYHKPSVLDE